ncbi:unnamed protein product, partial [Strongylus vulgaris]
KDDRRDHGGPRREYRGGGGYRRGGPDRNGDRDRGGRRRDDRRDRDDRSTWDVRPSAEEVAKQKKLLWGSKPAPAASGEGSSAGAEAQPDKVVDKNAGLWSSAITASGVAGEQANKFLKLMGIKNAPAVDPSSTDSKLLQEESEKQKKMMRDLDRQYEIARETTHMGRGLGLGFHQQ